MRYKFILSMALISFFYSVCNAQSETSLLSPEFKKNFRAIVRFSPNNRNSPYYGIVNIDGKLIKFPNYHDIMPFNETSGLAVFSEEFQKPNSTITKYGIINRDGRVILPPKFDNVGSSAYSGGFETTLAVKMSDKWGFIDVFGNFIIKPQFLNADDFDEETGLAPVKTKDGYGYIGKNGNFVIDMQFDYAKQFNEGAAIVRIGNKYGAIDNKGKIIINPQNYRIYSLNPRFKIAVIDMSTKENNQYRTAILNFDGTIIFNKTVDIMSGRFSKFGLCKVYLHPWMTSHGGGYINIYNNVVIPLQFDTADDFDDSTDLAIVGIGGDKESEVKYGAINENGEYVINPRFQKIGKFSKKWGIAIAEIKNKYVLIDKSGKILANLKHFNEVYQYDY